MECRPISSRPDTPAGETGSLEWIVTVECDDGSRHDVRVVVGEVAMGSNSEVVASLQQTEGKSAVLDALTADPTRAPVRILAAQKAVSPSTPTKHSDGAPARPSRSLAYLMDTRRSPHS